MLSIAFGRTLPVYHPSEQLSGDVVVNTKIPTKILELTVNYVGYSSVTFLMTKGKSNVCERVEETDTHLDVLHPLVRSYRGVDIDEGAQIYPFNLTLPSYLPSSFKSPYGHIKYYIHIRLQTSTTTLQVRKPFYMQAPVNINLFSCSQEGESDEVTKWYGLLTPKPLRLKASVSKSCFVPGDVIPVFVEISNESSRPIHYLFCTLKQMTVAAVQLEGGLEERVTKQCLVTVAHKLVDGKGHLSWICQLPTPAFLTPTIAASTIIFVTYHIQVSAKLSQVRIAPEVQIPIVFGTRDPVLALKSTEIQSSPSPKPLCKLDPEVHKSLKMAKEPEEYSVDETLPSATHPRRRITVCSIPKTGLNLQNKEQNTPTNFTTDEESWSKNIIPLNSLPNNPKRRITVCGHPERFQEQISQPGVENSPNDHVRRYGSTDSIPTTTVDRPQRNHWVQLMSQESVEDQTSAQTPILNRSKDQNPSTPRRKAVVYKQPEFGYATIIKYESRQEQINSRAAILQRTNVPSIIEETSSTTVSEEGEPENNNNRGNTTAGRRVGIQLHNIASLITRRLSVQWQSGLAQQFRRFSCENV